MIESVRSVAMREALLMRTGFVCPVRNCFSRLLARKSGVGNPAFGRVIAINYDIRATAIVITSYSIHYTKLYDNHEKLRINNGLTCKEERQTTGPGLFITACHTTGDGSPA